MTCLSLWFFLRPLDRYFLPFKTIFFLLLQSKLSIIIIPFLSAVERGQGCCVWVHCGRGKRKNFTVLLSQDLASNAFFVSFCSTFFLDTFSSVYCNATRSREMFSDNSKEQVLMMMPLMSGRSGWRRQEFSYCEFYVVLLFPWLLVSLEFTLTLLSPSCGECLGENSSVSSFIPHVSSSPTSCSLPFSFLAFVEFLICCVHVMYLLAVLGAHLFLLSEDYSLQTTTQEQQGMYSNAQESNINEKDKHCKEWNETMRKEDSLEPEITRTKELHDKRLSWRQGN